MRVLLIKILVVISLQYSNNFNSRILEITKKESLLWGLALFWFVTLQREFLFFYILIITFYNKKINSIQNKFFNFL